MLCLPCLQCLPCLAYLSASDTGAHCWRQREEPLLPQHLLLCYLQYGGTCARSKSHDSNLCSKAHGLPFPKISSIVELQDACMVECTFR